MNDDREDERMANCYSDPQIMLYIFGSACAGAGLGLLTLGVAFLWHAWNWNWP